MKIGDRVHWAAYKADGTVTELRSNDAYVFVEFDVPVPMPKFHLVGSMILKSQLTLINPIKDDPEWSELWEKTTT